MWFHVSNEPGDSDITELIIPSDERSHGECRIPRYSVSPTVGQCLLACPPLKDKDDNPIVDAIVYIKQIHVEDPVLPPPECDIRDLETTGERWIIQEVLDRANGRIRRAQIGKIHRTQELLDVLKGAFMRRRLKVTHEQEEKLWDKTGDVWKPTFADSKDFQEIVENKPLSRETGQPRQPVKARPMTFLSEEELGDPQDDDLGDPQDEDES